MRVLFSAQGGSGHWHPLAPLAAAMAAAGHEVAFATTPSTCHVIEQHGIRCFPAGADTDVQLNLSQAEVGAKPAGWIWANLFVEQRAARCLPDLLDLYREWRPDLVVRDLSEFASVIAAERYEIPHAVVQVGAWRPGLHAAIAEPLNRLRRVAGLRPDPGLDMLYRYLLLTPMPASYRRAEPPMPPTMREMRYVAYDRTVPGNDELLDWVEGLAGLPVVFVTLGTAFNRQPELLAAIIEAFRDEPVRLIVTTGPGMDGYDLGKGTSRVHVAPYLPLSLVFPRCELVVTHGGFNTVLTALDHGLPMVVLPIAADMADNGRRCAELGAAKVIERQARTPGAIRQAGRDILGDRGFRPGSFHSW